MILGIRAGLKRAPLEKRLLGHDPKTYKQITYWGMAIISVGLLWQMSGRQLLGVIWIIAGGSVVWKKEWARWLYIALACFHLAVISLAILSGYVSALLLSRRLEQYAVVMYSSISLFVIFLAWSIYFFSRPRVRDAFKFAAVKSEQSPLSSPHASTKPSID